MVRCDAGTETDPVLRHRRIINRRDPKAPLAKFVSQSIHALAIPNHQWHDVSFRRSSIDAKLGQLLVKVIRICPEPCAQLWAAGAQFERLQDGGDDDRWERAGVDVGMRVKAEVVE